MFELTFNTGNDSFVENEVSEFVRILNDVSYSLLKGETEGNVYDINGNKIGTWKWKK